MFGLAWYSNGRIDSSVFVFFYFLIMVYRYQICNKNIGFFKPTNGVVGSAKEEKFPIFL